MPSRQSMGVFLRVLCLALASTYGCSSTVTVKRWQPATMDVSGMHRVAILDFDGAHGDQIAAELSDRLWNNQFYTVVDQGELRPVQHAACSQSCSPDQLLSCARDRGIDGVIVGDVQVYRCEDQVVSEDKGRRGPTSAAEVDEPESHAIGLHPTEKIQREATVAIVFRLLDAQTGEVRAKHEAARHYLGDASAAPAGLQSRREILESLTSECLDEFIAQLAPHLVECDVELARGKWYLRSSADVRSGNRHATEGDWDTARDYWQSAVGRNPNCDAALYNLAIEAARRQRYGEAEELAMRAIRIRHTDHYAHGLEQIRLYRSGQEEVDQQRNQRVLQASALISR